MTSVKPYLEKILNQDLPVFIVSGQMDIRVSHLGIQKMISNLNWKHKNDYEVAGRKKWRVKSNLAGYAKTGGNLTYILMRNAGHMMIADQMEWSLDVVRRMVNELAF